MLNEKEKVELNDLAVKYGTDKMAIHHNYVSLYQEYFEKIRQEKLNVLEIGVLDGASMRMWKEYFPLSNITGIDVVSDKTQYAEDRIRIIIGDQQNETFLNSLCQENIQYDIIIDDGGHMPFGQITSFNYLFKIIKPGGIYVIEDLGTSYFNSPMYHDGYNIFVFLKNLINEINFNFKNINDVMFADKKNHLKYINTQEPEYCLNYFEKWVKSIHFYKNIVFILKDIWEN